MATIMEKDVLIEMTMATIAKIRRAVREKTQPKKKANLIIDGCGI